MSTDVTKPTLAPKPQGLDGFSSLPLAKCSSALISRAGLVHQKKPMSRGPKPPIAPKPVLSPATERRSIEDTNNSLNKCANGEADCSVDEIFDADNFSLECSESETLDMTYEDYIAAPDSQLTDEEGADFECEKSSCFEVCTGTWGTPPGEGDIINDKSCSPSAVGEEDSGRPDSVPSGDVESGDSTEVEDSDNTDALSLRSSSTAEADSLVPPPGCENLQFKSDLENMEDFLPVEVNECNTEDEEIDSDLKIMPCGDVILTEVCLDNLTVPDETSQKEDMNCESSWEVTPYNEDSLEVCVAIEDSVVKSEVEVVDACLLQGSSAHSDETEEVQQEIAAETSDCVVETTEEATSEDEICKEPQESSNCNEDLAVDLTGSNNAEEEEDHQESIDDEINERECKEDITDDNTQITEIAEEEMEDVGEEDNAEESCQIIPFENEVSEDVAEAPEDLSYLANGLDNNLISEPIIESEMEEKDECISDKGQSDKEPETGDTEQSTEVSDTAANGDGSNTWDEHPSALTQGEVIEGGEADTAEVSPENQEGEVNQLSVASEENTPKSEVIVEEEDESNPYVLEDSVQSRNRKLLSVEDSGLTRADGEAIRHHPMMEEGNYDGDNHLLCIDRKNIVTRTRSYSGKIPGNVPETVPEETGAEIDSQTLVCDSRTKSIVDKPEPKALDLGRALPRKPSRFILYPRSYSVEGRENTVSLYMESDVHFSPYVISSSGSFSQRHNHPSSGMSTPTSVVDIPPPFELASITKKPITKSSPSLLIENESSEKSFKKKKSSFKRFLTLKFKKKTENKVHVDVNVSSSRSSSESSYHGQSRLLDMDRRSLGNSPQLHRHSGMHFLPDSPSAILYYKDMKKKGTSKAFNRSVARVESFEDRSRAAFMPLPLTKPRSISFPNADTSDYENIPAMSSDYENIQIPPRRPARAGTFTEFFEDPSRALSSANENDGYVDMSSFNTFEVKQQTPEKEAESAYTEPYKVCPISVNNTEDFTSDEDQKSSEDEENSPGEGGIVQKKGTLRALSIVEELLTSEKVYVEMLKRLHTEFHASVLRVLGGEEEDGEEELRLRHGLSELHYIYLLHEEVLQELQERIQHWEENQKIAGVFLSRQSRFQHHTAFIVAFDKTTAALDNCTLKNPKMAHAVREFEKNLQRGEASVKHELMKVVQRVFQYHMILTDYLNNLCPDWTEYEDTQAALLIVSEVADRANDSMRQGENLQKLIQIEYSVRGQKSLLQPGREFVKEGTLMKVAGKNCHPRHLFLMNDVLLYTYPQKDGKYRLKNTLSIPGMRVSRPIVENTQNVLKIECMECCLMLSASSCSERDEWYSCISRTVQEYYKAPTVSVYHSIELRERLGMCLGERPPSVVHMSHVTMCMNCGSDFTLTLRRHHCHACGKTVCRSCSRNKYPLKYLRDRPSKVCNGCYAELRKRELAAANTNSSPPPQRSTASTLSSMFHISPSTFRKHKKIPSALMEAASSGENATISGYLHRCKKGKKYWKKRWFVIKGKVLYTYTACEDKVATESLPLLGFRIVPDNWDENPKLGTVFQLHHKQTLFYSFKATDTNSAIRWVEAIKAATVL
ncbi:FYVE, RhoGEF and PH domain-containing protein 5 isoform X2 [Spea bombifrons]|uniref:FYVE, RhoGEF and PH domain-containing protein 5 isoform X2 n=1 Tax=Spea bombifrons TaxID=233779 RepID=UPI00234B4072|nr:FYVE, RhoGEF and PH domain-containing protein 5 isoform X2 [Spea bombifrons]